MNLVTQIGVLLLFWSDETDGRRLGGEFQRRVYRVKKKFFDGVIIESQRGDETTWERLDTIFARRSTTRARGSSPETPKNAAIA